MLTTWLVLHSIYALALFTRWSFKLSQGDYDKCGSAADADALAGHACMAILPVFGIPYMLGKYLSDRKNAALEKAKELQVVEARQERLLREAGL